MNITFNARNGIIFYEWTINSHKLSYRQTFRIFLFSLSLCYGK